MPKTIPFPTKPKQAPEEAPGIPDIPEESKLESKELKSSTLVEVLPNTSKLKEEIPEKTPEKETIPDPSPEKEEMPTDLNMENVVVIGGKQIEIKPTKLKYFRNKTTASYAYLKAVPLTEFLSYDKGVFDKNKDADQLLYDFLVAAFDDATFVRDNYDEMTADDVEKVIQIFGRINHINEKEEAARKNREAQGNR